MSILERVEEDGRVVEVRGAGRTHRLYVDGVFHSAWNPTRPLTGAVWDHLALPTFLVRPEGAASALVLGVGGGAVLRMLRELTTPTALVGVELDGLLLQLAKRWFGLGASRAELVHDDAASWVFSNTERRFELVVDDVFGEEDGEPVRPEGLDDGPWWHALSSLVAPGGVLAVNHVERRDLLRSDLCLDPAFRARFPAAIYFTCPGYENAAVALMTKPVTRQAFRARLAAHPALSNAAARRLLRFRVHTLWKP